MCKTVVSINEFKDKIVLSALAAQDSTTENLTVIWIANQVHKTVCVVMAQRWTPLDIESFWENTKPRKH